MANPRDALRRFGARVYCITCGREMRADAKAERCKSCTLILAAMTDDGGTK